ncbi:MAG TPA: sigma factor-like helix-turn-helix DNA-binding protein [Ilumatobacter sp.]|nr:sigma factor-like helix-turn-helix DNA-binding protein [Ilumatobacter sp.]
MDRQAEFAAFFELAQPRLQRALTAAYGVVDGRAVTVDAMSWAWENWDRLQPMANPVGYLFRVGQSSIRTYSTRPISSFADPTIASPDEAFPDDDRELIDALAGLPMRQRTIVVLIHALGWSQVDVAELFDVSPSTVNAHLRRGLDRLRNELQNSHAG